MVLVDKNICLLDPFHTDILFEVAVAEVYFTK